MALRITETGLAAIDVDDDVTAAPKETSIGPAPAREVEPPAAKASSSAVSRLAVIRMIKVKTGR